MEQEDKWLEMSYYRYIEKNIIERLNDMERDFLDIYDDEVEEED